MQAGEIVYLRYHGGPGVIHTRLLIGCVQDDEWMIVTPDEDIYVEELARHNPDLQYMCHAPDGWLARGVPANQVYGFAPMTAAQCAALVRRGRAELDAELGRRGVGGGALAPGGRCCWSCGVGPVVAAPVAAVPAMAQAGAAAPVAALAVAVPSGGPGARDLSGRGLHRMPDGSELFCMCINESRRQGFNNRPAQCDGRILGRGFNTWGLPERPLSEMVAASTEYDMGWKITGPRTTQ